MAETSKIQWTDATFNPWRGCQKISPGCAHCYAETLSHRNPKTLGVWGPNGTRVIAGESYWRQPAKWNATAEAAGVRRRVFCCSLADVFEDRPELDAPRQRLFDLILQTPWLDWQILTKRPDIMKDWLTGTDLGRGHRNAHAWGNGWPNVWLGVSVENQDAAKERVPVLLSIPAAVHWLSCEPLLGPLDLDDYLSSHHTPPFGRKPVKWPHGRIQWVIVGGESGGQARPMDIEWARRIVLDCRFSAPCFVKQLGSVWAANNPGSTAKGDAPSEWPEWLRVREFPQQVAQAR